MVRTVKFIRWYALALLGITIGLLLWHQFGMNRVLPLDSRSSFPIWLIDDAHSGGNTRSHLFREGPRIILDTELKKGFAWPFAQLEFGLSRGSTGIDLSRFDELRIKAQYDGPGSTSLRIFLRNYNPAYSKLSDTNSFKPNEAGFRLSMDSGIKHVSLKKLSVSGWWFKDFQISIENAGVDLSNVVLIQVSTGERPEMGHHRITIDQMELCGKWISREYLVMGLLALWFGSALLFLILDLHGVQRNLRLSHTREKQLKELTEALQLENRAIGEMARMDPLTGVRNRAGILDELFHEAETALRSGQPLALIFADIDRFKLVNDTHGHAAGDDVLQQFARELESLIRRSDYLIRWGGEEFMIITPGTPMENAEKLAEKIRKRLEEVSWPLGISVTASFGVTILGNEPVPDCLRRVDEAMYAAKAGGRNRVAGLFPPR